MTNTSIAPIQLTLQTTADVARAWEYLVDPARVAEWFTDASPLGTVGELYRLDFGEGSLVEGSIVAHDPGRQFAYRWAWIDAEPLQETLVTWSVRPSDSGGAEIELVHDGWDEAGADSAQRDDHEAYWSGYLDDLRDLLEETAGS